MKLLFVCSAGMNRSPTAAALFSSFGHETSFFGINYLDNLLLHDRILEYNEVRAAMHRLVEWADRVFVMEACHSEAMIRHGVMVNDTNITILGIPDVYVRDQFGLVILLEEKVILDA